MDFQRGVFCSGWWRCENHEGNTAFLTAPPAAASRSAAVQTGHWGLGLLLTLPGMLPAKTLFVAVMSARGPTSGLGHMGRPGQIIVFL